jgi:hypothetical protein
MTDQRFAIADDEAHFDARVQLTESSQQTRCEIIRGADQADRNTACFQAF